MRPSLPPQMPTYIVDEHGNVIFLTRPSGKRKRNAGSLGSGIRCPECNAELKSDVRLKKHLRNVHPSFATDSVVQAPLSVATGISTSHAGGATGNVSKGRAQNSNQDAADGSKGLGHFARESGRFGSYPAHDDYGDESSVF